MPATIPPAHEYARRVHETNISVWDTAAAEPRPDGAVYMGGYRAPALDRVRVALVGLNKRGLHLLRQIVHIPHAEVVGVCDLSAERVEEAAEVVANSGGRRPAIYHAGTDAYLGMLDKTAPDAVFVCTPWELHAPMAVCAMEHGAHAFVEVPLALTLEDLWRVVDTAERTQRHCMMLSNVNYGREELMFLNIVRRGLIGTPVHAEGAYIHNLCPRMLHGGDGEGLWRTYHYAARNGNLYPTHGIGPVAQYMNIARTDDTFERLVSLGSPAEGFSAYAAGHFPADHEWNRIRFRCADMNTTVIRTQAGRTILAQWAETGVHPYDRRNFIQGTKGTLAGYPLRVCSIDPCLVPSAAERNGGTDGEFSWYGGDKAAHGLYARFEHPLYKRLGEQGCRYDCHGGMNYLMLSRIVESLHRGEALDQNVYEGALWSAIAPLSEKSVHEGGMPQRFPDFTRGGWKTTPPLDIVG